MTEIFSRFWARGQVKRYPVLNCLRGFSTFIGDVYVKSRFS